MDEVLQILILLYVVIWISGVLVGFAYRKRFRVLYPELAAKLHPPQKSIGADWRATQFLLRREYLSLDNKEFVRLCETNRRLILLIMVGMFVLAVVIMANGMGKAASR